MQFQDFWWLSSLWIWIGTMLLKAPAAVSTASAAAASFQQQGGLQTRFIGDKFNVGFAVKVNQKRSALHLSVARPRAMADAAKSGSSLSGIVFEPFAEVQNELVLVSRSYSQSLARQRFSDPCELALNEQINVEYNVSYIYHALFAFFDRDYVGLPGFAKYFKESSEKERDYAEILMKYQNKRGGKVMLHSILMPVMEFENSEKGDALYAMELALSLEKLSNEKLFKLHSVAAEANDSQMTDFIEGVFLAAQVETIKKVSEYVAQLRRIGKGHAVWHFDQMLLNDDGNQLEPAAEAAVAPAAVA